MAEATLYGKLNVSVDYIDMNNAIAPTEQTLGLPGPLSGAWQPVPNTDLLSFTDPATGQTFQITQSAAETAALNGQGFGINAVVVDASGNPVVGTPGQDFDGWGVNGDAYRDFPGIRGDLPIALAPIPSPKSRANRIGVKGSEDLAYGLKAIYQVELGLNLSAADDNITSGNNGISFRNSFVGLAGDWGTFLVGRHDTPLKISTGRLDQFSDTMADYNGTVGFQGLRTDNTIAYISPSFRGFSFAGAVIAPGGATDTGAQNINSDSLAEAWSIAGIYSNGPFYASAAFESLGNEMFMDSDTSLAGSSGCIGPAGNALLNCDYIDDDATTYTFSLGLLDWNGFTLSGMFEKQEDLPTGQRSVGVATVNPDGTVNVFGQRGVEEQRLWQIQAGYAFGNNKIKGMYGAVDRDAGKAFGNTRDSLSINSIKDDLEGDRETWAIGFDHNFSKRTTAYALYTDVEDDLDGLPGVSGAEWSGFSAGIIHKF
jgi:predicted porin